jgi:hypothetical protein
MESRAFRVTRWILIILAVFLMVTFVIFILARPNSNKDSSKASEKPTSIMDYSTTGTAIFTQIGSVSAPETHQSIAISISNSSRSLYIYTGYGNAPTISKSFTSTQASFDAFMQAIGGAGFLSSRTGSSGSLEGSCTLGVRFTYQLNNNTSTLPVNTWGNTCSNKQGTFAGSVSNTQQLFKAQIPDYNTLTNGVVL